MTLNKAVWKEIIQAHGGVNLDNTFLNVRRMRYDLPDWDEIANLGGARRRRVALYTCCWKKPGLLLEPVMSGLPNPWLAGRFLRDFKKAPGDYHDGTSR